MKPVLLSLSLVANVALLGGVAYLVLTSPAPQSINKIEAEDTRNLPKPASPSHVAPAPLSAVTVPAPAPWQSPADIQAWLRSTDAPLAVRYAVADAMIQQKYKAAYEAVRFPPGMKRWQRSATRPTPEQIDQQSALRTQQEEEMKQLLGADYIQARYGEAEERSGLPAEKIAEINRVGRDYMDARRKLGTDGMRPDVSRLMEAEMSADLRRILTPAEYDLHQAYESQEGQQLQRALAGLDIDDETYLRVYRAVAEVKAGNKQPGYAPNVRLEEIGAIEKAVGPEIAAHITMNQDATYREIGALYPTGSLPATAMLDKYQTWLQFYKATQGWGPNTQLSDSHLTLVRSYRDRLTEGLSDADRTKFDRTRTGMLMARLLGGK